MNETVNTSPTPEHSSQRELEVANLSYEQAREKLVQIIQQMETGNLPLEETLKVWEQAQALVDRCQEVLEAAKSRVAHSGENTSSE